MKFRIKTFKSEVVAFLLIPIILMGHLSFYLHIFSHRHTAHSVLHNDKLESDPCHISIFHGKLAKACAHHVHFTEQKDHCNIFNLFIVVPFAFCQGSTLCELNPIELKISRISLENGKELSNRIQNRGPPYDKLNYRV